MQIDINSVSERVAQKSSTAVERVKRLGVGHSPAPTVLILRAAESIEKRDTNCERSWTKSAAASDSIQFLGAL